MSRGNALNVEGAAIELRAAEVPERERIGARVHSREQANEREATLQPGDSVQHELDLAYVHTYEGKRRAQLRLGRPTRHVPDVDEIERRRL